MRVALPWACLDAMRTLNIFLKFIFGTNRCFQLKNARGKRTNRKKRTKVSHLPKRFFRSVGRPFLCRMTIQDMQNIATAANVAATEFKLSGLLLRLGEQLESIEQRLRILEMGLLPDQEIRPEELAHLMGVSATTVRRWCREGSVRARQTRGRGCNWSIPRSEALRLRDKTESRRLPDDAPTIKIG